MRWLSILAESNSSSPRLSHLGLRTHAISCLPINYTQNVNQGHTFSAHMKATVQCLTMALLILVGVLHKKRNPETHFAFQNTKYCLLNKHFNETVTIFTALTMQGPMVSINKYKFNEAWNSLVIKQISWVNCNRVWCHCLLIILS